MALFRSRACGPAFLVGGVTAGSAREGFVGTRENDYRRLGAKGFVGPALRRLVAEPTFAGGWLRGFLASHVVVVERDWGILS